MKHKYMMTLAIALDRFGAAIFFNMTDCCISSLCWVMLVAAKRLTATVAETALCHTALASLNPYRWQEEALLLIGRALEWHWPGHCKASANADILTAMRTISYLQP